MVQSRLDLLNDDWDVISSVERQLQLYKEDMQEDFNYRMADVENILLFYGTTRPGILEEYLRIARIPDLLKKKTERGILKPRWLPIHRTD